MAFWLGFLARGYRKPVKDWVFNVYYLSLYLPKGYTYTELLVFRIGGHVDY